MCGFTGFLSSKLPDDTHAIISKMADALTHRGPDDKGVWVDENSGIALGHRRLSILDLSSAGHQPMLSKSKRYAIAYNGEVYNFPDLKIELEGKGHTFTSHSDTEVILCSIEEWGLVAALKRFNGMFAFALWDKKLRTLHLVRDRLGIKPLYWGNFDNLLLFGSELKAFHKHPHFKPQISTSSLALYLQYGYIPAPHAIFEKVYKLEPGKILTVSESFEISIQSYWSLEDVTQKGINTRNLESSPSFEEATNTLEYLLKDAVKIRQLSDVPVGAFLSGGVDSSTVAALMQSVSNTPIKTFTIGFNEKEYNEAKHAKKVAEHLGTDHTELYLEPKECLDIILSIPVWYDEPFADSSQIPTYLVSKLARQQVTVSLSGDGGDELFTGYNRYTFSHSLWKIISAFPQATRPLIRFMIQRLSPNAWNKVGNLIHSPQRQLGDKLYKFIELLAYHSIDQVYARLISQWLKPQDLLVNQFNQKNPYSEKGYSEKYPNALDRMQYFDSRYYLPDDILTKVDRASMAVGLEARVPLLDYRVVEFAWSLPQDYKIQTGCSKRILRNVLYKYVPKNLIERPKMGFGVPIGEWLRGPLKEWAEELLDPQRLESEGLLNSEPIQMKWREHLEGKYNWQYPLWTILMFQAWKEKWC